MCRFGRTAPGRLHEGKLGLRHIERAENPPLNMYSACLMGLLAILCGFKGFLGMSAAACLHFAVVVCVCFFYGVVDVHR